MPTPGEEERAAQVVTRMCTSSRGAVRRVVSLNILLHFTLQILLLTWEY